jgi:hypothetical protein
LVLLVRAQASSPLRRAELRSGRSGGYDAVSSHHWRIALLEVERADLLGITIWYFDDTTVGPVRASIQSMSSTVL